MKMQLQASELNASWIQNKLFLGQEYLNLFFSRL